VGRVEILEHGQAFLEVRDDRASISSPEGLDITPRIAGELAHLRRRAARAGMRHHVDRVDRNLALAVRLLTHGPRFPASSASAMRSVHFDQASTTLLYFSPSVMVPSLYCCSYSFGERPGLLDDLPLGARTTMSSLPNEDAGLEGVMESERHDAVAEDHGVLLAAVAVDHVDHGRDFALGHELVSRASNEIFGDFAALWPSMTRPGVVSCHVLVGLSLSSTPVEAILDLLWSVMTLALSACSIDAMLPKVLPWPGSLSRISDR